MNKEYFLIGFRTTTGKQGFNIIDKTNCRTIKEAQTEFERRNNFKKLLEKYDLRIAKTDRWFN